VLISVRRSSKSVFTLVALCGALWAQSPTTGTRPDDYVARAKQLFRRLYPDLDDGLKAVIIDGNRLREGDVMSIFWIEFHDLQPKFREPPRACWCSAPVLQAQMIFDWTTEDKDLSIMFAGGPLIDARGDKFSAEMSKHPEWPDARILAALSDAGAKYGPNHKAEFLRALRFEDLQPVVGKLELLSADFHLQRYDDDGGVSKTDAYWSVRTTRHDSGGPDAVWDLTFEAFDGKLTGIRRSVSTQKAGEK
jgi:hypothetical protein